MQQLIDQCRDMRERCQVHAWAHRTRAGLDDSRAQLLGLAVLLSGVSALVVGHRAPDAGEWVATLAAALAVVDAYLHLPRRAADHRLAVAQFGALDTELAALLAWLANASATVQEAHDRVPRTTARFWMIEQTAPHLTPAQLERGKTHVLAR